MHALNALIDTWVKEERDATRMVDMARQCGRPASMASGIADTLLKCRIQLQVALTCESGPDVIEALRDLLTAADMYGGSHNIHDQLTAAKAKASAVIKKSK